MPTCRRHHLICGHASLLSLTLSLLASGEPRAVAQTPAATFTSSVLSYSENFDAMAATTAFLPGWTGYRTNGATSAATTVVIVSNGSGNAGGIYNVGTTGATDRALGSIASGSWAPAIFGASFLNSTGSTINSLNFAGFMEQWRQGSSATALETGAFSFSLDATSISAAATWAPLTSFDLVEKLVDFNLTTNNNVDGNLDANRTAIGGRAELSWLPNTTLWIRWQDQNDGGNDGLYAIDDFKLDVTLASIPAYWDLNGATAGVGGATGTWDATTANWSSDFAGSVATTIHSTTTGAHFAGLDTGPKSVVIAPGGITAGGGMEFETEGYTISGGPLTIGAAISTSHVSGVSTIASVIDGTVGLTKTGVGTLKLTGANIFTGKVTLSGGVLQIGNDSNLGDAANDVSLSGGSLAITANVALNAGRDLSGSGAINLGGFSLTINGLLSVSTLGLNGGGTVNLAGTTATAGTLSFDTPATLTGPASGLSISGGITSSATTGVVTINGPLTLPGGSPTFNVADGSADVDMLLNGNISGAGKFTLVGGGTLKMTGSNTGLTGGVKLGVAATAAVAGGRLIFSDINALGTGAAAQIQFNDGTLEATTAMTGANAIALGISFGAGQLNSATFAGAPMEFTGATSLFKPGGTSYAHRITANTQVIFSGAFGLSTSTGTAASLDIDGLATGSVTFAAAANPMVEPIKVNGPTFIVTGSLSAASVSIYNGALKVAPGAVLKSLYVGDDVDAAAILSFTGSTPGALTTDLMDLASDTVLNIRVDSSLSQVDRFVVNGDLILEDGLATLNFLPQGSGTIAAGTEFVLFDSVLPTSLATGFFKDRPDLSKFLIGTTQFQLDYNAGPDGNDVILRAVPEPATWLSLGLGAAALGLGRVRRPSTRSLL